MPNETKILELLIAQNSDIAATKSTVEEISAQMSNIFERLLSLEKYRAQEQGKEQGVKVATEANKDVWSRVISVISAILAAGATYFSVKGH